MTRRFAIIMILLLLGNITLLSQEVRDDVFVKAQQWRDSSQWDSAIYYLEKAIENFQQKGLSINSFNARILLNDSRIEALHFEQADSALNQLLIEARTKFPEIDINLAKVLDLQGKVAIELGRYTEAVGKLQESLAIRRNLNLKDDATGLTYYRLGDAWRSQGVVDSAMAAYESALEIRQNLFGDESEKVAAVWSNIAILHRITGNYDQAMRIYEKSDSVIVKVFGPDHKRRGSILNGMAIIHAQSARYPQALEYFNQLLQIDLKTLASDSPTLARTYT
ncbi:MAG: tetratricopeptide repeat protein, partial [Saprospiraceae bacterium]|nr:tetratricopeptide repeat protein [Saprospiraceae bacterium]